MKRQGIAFIVPALASFLMLGCLHNPLEQKWRKRHKEGIFSPFSSEVISISSPVIEGTELYFGTQNKTLVSYDIQKRSIKWRFRADSIVESTPRIEGDAVYFGTSDGTFYRLNRSDGKMLWSYKSDGEVYSQAEINPDGIVYFVSAGSVLTALDSKSGEWLWHYRRPPDRKVTIKGLSSPLFLDKGLLIVGFDDGFVSALNPNDGSVIWEKPIARKGRFIDVDAKAVHKNGLIYFPTYEEGLFALDYDGNIVWKFQKGGSSSRIFVENGHLYFVCNSQDIYKLDAKSGKEIWASKFDHIAPSNPVILGNRLIFATYGGRMYVFDKNDGRFIWKYKFGSNIRGDIIKHLDHIYLLTSKAEIYVFSGR